MPKALCTGWYEVDLANAQLAVLRGRESLGELAEHAGGQLPELKPILKQALYGVLFGQARKKTRAFLAANGAEDALNHLLIAPLYKVRQQVYRRISEARGMKDAFNEWQVLVKGSAKHGRRPHQILATVLQSYEMTLIEPVYDLAISGAPRFKVVLHLHDGS